MNSPLHWLLKRQTCFRLCLFSSRLSNPESIIISMRLQYQKNVKNEKKILHFSPTKIFLGYSIEAGF
uniref:Ovule protein n=1 Tax=Meloidogyne incognita TaxID=6306 RepID=A0A914LT50_MELIC